VGSRQNVSTLEVDIEVPNDCEESAKAPGTGVWPAEALAVKLHRRVEL